MTVTALIPQARHLAPVLTRPDPPTTTGSAPPGGAGPAGGTEPRMTFNLQISVAGSALSSEAAKVLRDIRELAEQMRRASGNAGFAAPGEGSGGDEDAGGGSGVTVTVLPAIPAPPTATATSPSMMDSNQEGVLWIEPASRVVVQDGRPVQLTRREFDLLLFLCEHPRRVFSRDQLLSNVWGYEWVGGSRTVDVHVRRLRIKLGRHGAVVRTVHGVGYRLADDLDVRIG